MIKEYRNCINGKWCRSVSGKTFKNINPANTDDVIGNFQDSGGKDIKEAIAAAEAAFRKWNQRPITSRETYLYEAAEVLNRRAEEMAKVITREVGKTAQEAKGEVIRGIQILRYFAGEARRLCGETYPSESPNTLLFTLREPLGVVGLITPWNFPVAIPLWKIAPAIVYGNTSILKPSEDAPCAGILIGEIFEEAGIPPGVINVITGFGPDIGKALVDAEGVAAISFTGSVEVGRQINQRCGELNKKVQLELGGQNPLIIMPETNLDHAVDIAVAGGFLSAGQKCTSTRRVIVQRSILNEFTEKLVTKCADLEIGDGAKEDTQIGPIINQKQLSKILTVIDQAKKEGARLIYGGQRLIDDGFDKGFFIQPTVFADVKPEMTIAKTEVFGPLMGIMPFAELDEALKIANSVIYGLSASLVANDIGSAVKFVREIKAGLVHVNSQTAGAECHVPFGGMKASSSGTREQGKASLEFFTQLKTVYFDPP